MAKKETKPTTAARKPVRRPTARTATRARKSEVTQEAIAHRAYELYQSGSTGSAFDDWVRAENELRV
jgi:Protein of unknown function (DUF2934)